MDTAFVCPLDFLFDCLVVRLECLQVLSVHLHGFRVDVLCNDVDALLISLLVETGRDKKQHLANVVL